MGVDDLWHPLLVCSQAGDPGPQVVFARLRVLFYNLCRSLWIVCQSAPLRKIESVERERYDKIERGSIMKIFAATEASEALVAAFARLIPQLSSSSPPLTRAELEAVIASPVSTLLVATDPARDEQVVGTLTLVLFRIPTGMRAWIEDVVVDGEYRRKGIGTALIREALERARDAGARTVDLTSRPSREAANRLYQQIGFAQRETNVYRYTFGR
jgi:ribosomal protein S18 acetylase RimI-like enzyme